MTTNNTKQMISAFKIHFGSENVSGNKVKMYAESIGYSRISWKEVDQYKIGKTFCFADAPTVTQPDNFVPPATVAVSVPDSNHQLDYYVPNTQKMVQNHSMMTSEESFVPDVDKCYVPFGIYGDINTIIKTNKFFPCYITGETGIGKTLAVIQACAKNKRELIRFNVTAQTEESDLLGDFRLVDGEMIFAKGPVVEAMERGAVLLLDELSAGNPNSLLSLQSVLEGKGVCLKKIGKQIAHKDGFTIIATDNSKGKGSASGRYLGLNILNEAFLDRFIVTFSHTYPTKSVEKRILKSFAFNSNIEVTDNFIDVLVNWSEIIRKTFEADGCDEVISTRRLVNILSLFSVFGNEAKCIEMAINRFDDETISAFSSLFGKLWSGEQQMEKIEEDEDISPFSAI